MIRYLVAVKARDGDGDRVEVEVKDIGNRERGVD